MWWLLIHVKMLHVSAIWFVIRVRSRWYLYDSSVLHFFQPLRYSGLGHLQRCLYFWFIIKHRDGATDWKYICTVLCVRSYYTTDFLSGRLTAWEVRSQSSADGRLTKCTQNVVINCFPCFHVHQWRPLENPIDAAWYWGLTCDSLPRITSFPNANNPSLYFVA